MRAALGRMVDVDIAEETTNVAKYSILPGSSIRCSLELIQVWMLALMLPSINQWIRVSGEM